MAAESGAITLDDAVDRLQRYDTGLGDFCGEGAEDPVAAVQ